MGRGNELLTIGELAARTGLSVSAMRFYEGKGLVHPIRTQRQPAALPAFGHPPRLVRADRAAIGLHAAADRDRAGEAAQGRAPTPPTGSGSAAVSGGASSADRELQRTLDDLDGCIGCGCLTFG